MRIFIILIFTIFGYLAFLQSAHAMTQEKSMLFSKEGYIDVTGGKVWYKKFYTKETEDNVPLLILHGGPGFPHNYLLSLKDIAKTHPVIFYDQLGCGNSIILNSPENKKLWNVAHYVDELNSVVVALHLKKFHLLGQSWGGALAVEYALKHQEKLASLILASPLLSTSVWVKDSRRLIAQLPKETQDIIYRNEENGTTSTQEYLSAVQVFYHHFLCRLPKWPGELQYSFDHMNTEIYNTMWGPSEFTMTGNLVNFDRLNDLKNIKVPTLITCGRYDEATPETMALALSKLPHGQLVIFENSGHLSHLEEKNKYLKTLTEFLK